jgi:hypothetical protein
MAKQEEKICYQAVCQTCGWRGGIHTDYKKANGDAEDHLLHHKEGKINIYNPPC